MTPTPSIQTDPTYLRYIVDGLENQSLHRDGIASLPDGLIGIYEGAIPNDRQLGLRERFLDFFAIWALLKKEVSVSFILPLLHWQPQVAMDFLSLHTKWFNSPSSGKYLLYHDRLRVYLLERIPSHKLDKTNRKIIATCQSALQQPSGDEWEQYALEHLPSHLLIPALQQEADGEAFKQLVNDTAFWNRQLEVSKGYDWTKKMLNQSMAWAAKQNTDELIGFALNKVDLHYMEQNDAPRIVELVAQHDMDTALQRIEAFGGNHKEGLQRKFTLYMLCLMELTLLGSKDKPFRRLAIKRLLNHFDEKLPTDHSILNWNDFFSSYLMFQLACAWEDMGLDYLRVYNRTDEWENYWIREKGPYSEFQFEILLVCARGISDEMEKSKVLIAISTEMVKQDKLQEALASISDISNDFTKIEGLNAISSELTEQGKLDEASFVIQEALTCIRGISDEILKIEGLNAISSELTKQGKLDQAASVFEEALTRTIDNNDEWIAHKELLEMISEFKELRKLEKVPSIISDLVKKREFEVAASAIMSNLVYERSVICKIDKIKELNVVSSELTKQGKVKEAGLVIQEVITSCEVITNEKDKHNLFLLICIELANQGKFEKALTCTGFINDELVKIEALNAISSELSIKGKLEDAAAIIKESFLYADRIVGLANSIALIRIISELAKQGLFQEAISFSRNFTHNHVKSKALSSIASELLKQGHLKEAGSVILEAHLFAMEITEEWEKSDALSFISLELAKQGKLEEAVTCIKDISVDVSKIQGMIVLFSELTNQNKLKEADLVIQETIQCAIGISIDYIKYIQLCEISSELAKQGNWKLAEKLGLEIPQIGDRQKCWKEIAKSVKNDNNLLIALEKYSMLQSDEARVFYLKGLAESINLNDFDVLSLKESLPFFIGDSDSIEKILQAFSQRELFFSNPSQEKINRLNKTLNIQWAIDIRDKFQQQSAKLNSDN